MEGKLHFRFVYSGFATFLFFYAQGAMACNQDYIIENHTNYAIVGIFVEENKTISTDNILECVRYRDENCNNIIDYVVENGEPEEITLDGVYRKSLIFVTSDGKIHKKYVENSCVFGGIDIHINEYTNAIEITLK